MRHGIDLLPRRHGPSNLGRLVGERHRRDLCGLTLEQARHPGLASRIPARHSHYSSRPDHEQTAKIAIALFGYSAQPLLAASTVRTGREPKPDGELSA